MSGQLAEAIAYAQAVLAGAGPGSVERMEDAAYIYREAIKAKQPSHVALLAAIGSLRDAAVGQQAQRRGAQTPFAPESARTMVKAIAMMAEVSVRTFLGSGRSVHLARWRRLAYYVLHKHGFSLPVIGAAMGGRDHSTVLFGVRRFEELLPGDPEMQRLVEKLVVEPVTSEPSREAA